MITTQDYTLSFVFDAARAHVLLIRKQRPAWQAGLLNGVGGHLEAGETPLECIRRELREESNLDILPEAWHVVGEMAGDHWRVFVFTAIYAGDPAAAQSLTDERICWVPRDALPDDVISNLHWLIPLCLDRLQNGAPVFAARYDG